jgi:membrane protease YdiL (CAAX protease family)
VARPLLGGTKALMVLFVALLLVGGVWPLATDVRAGGKPEEAGEAKAPPPVMLLVLLAGIAAFAVGRLLGGGRPPVPATPTYVAAITLAAVAEEAFFRRFVYAVLRPGGAAWAVAGSTALFAIAHVTVYGWWVLPLDLAAGLILGWQRWATGSWTVPAATHAAANLLIVL